MDLRVVIVLVLRGKGKLDKMQINKSPNQQMGKSANEQIARSPNE
jgi:hypothetical protein